VSANTKIAWTDHRPQSGPRNHQWKGGRTVASNGYVLLRRPGHPMADCRGYVYEHRLVASEMLGRPLSPREQVHHRNENKLDNRPENLEVTPSRAHHAVEHRKLDVGRRLPDEANPVVECECGCGQTFSRFDGYGRPRIYVTGHNTAERNRRCG
jgi:hypothetical protein